MENCSSRDLANLSLCNTSSVSRFDAITDTRIFNVTYASILSVIFVVSVVGNSFTCYVIATRHLMKNIIWFYLFILSVCDGAMSLTAIPTILLGCYNERFLSIPWICKFNIFTMIFFGTFTVYTVAAVSVHKFRHISKPLSSLANRGFCGFTGYFVFTLTIALGLTLPPMFGFSGYVHIPGRRWCSLWSPKQIDHSMIMLGVLVLFGYVVPFFIIVGTSIRTFFVFRKHNTKMKPIRRLSSAELHAENRAILQTLFVVVGLFLLLWTPLTLYAFFGVIKVRLPLLFVHISYILMLSQGCVNPIIYYYKHVVFKDVFRKISHITARGLRRLSSLYDDSNKRGRVTPSPGPSLRPISSPSPPSSPYHVIKVVPTESRETTMEEKKKRSSERMHYENPIFGAGELKHKRDKRSDTLESKMSLDNGT